MVQNNVWVVGYSWHACSVKLHWQESRNVKQKGKFMQCVFIARLSTFAVGLLDQLARVLRKGATKPPCLAVIKSTFFTWDEGHSPFRSIQIVSWCIFESEQCFSFLLNTRNSWSTNKYDFWRIFPLPVWFLFNSQMKMLSHPLVFTNPGLSSVQCYFTL